MRNARCWLSAVTSSRRNSNKLSIINGRAHSFWLDRDVGRKANGSSPAHGRLEPGVAVRTPSVRRAATPPLGSMPIHPRTVGSGWTRLSGASRHGSPTLMTTPRSVRSASLGVSTKTPAARWPMGLPAHSSQPSGRYHRSCTKRASTARSCRSSQSPLRISSLTPCGSKWAWNWPNDCQNLLKSVVLRSARCQHHPHWHGALQPGASSSFSVVEQAGAWGKIDDAFFLTSQRGKICCFTRARLAISP